MSAFLYGIILQWKLDLRNKGVIIVYYVVPLIFFAFMGGIFTSIDPNAKDTLIQSMTVFGVTMGAILGTPTLLVELYGNEIKKAYKVGGIPLWAAAVNNFISAFIHLFIVSLVIYFAAPIAFNATRPTSVVHYFVSLSIFIITCIAVGTVLGLNIKSVSKLTMASQFIFLPSIMLSGIMFPADMLPSILRGIGKIFPATWGFALMQQSSISIQNLLPLFIILGVALCINAWCIMKINMD